MNRRKFLATVGSGALGLALPLKSYSEVQCSQPLVYPNGYATQNCSAGIPSGILSFVAARQQKYSMVLGCLYTNDVQTIWI